MNENTLKRTRKKNAERLYEQGKLTNEEMQKLPKLNWYISELPNRKKNLGTGSYNLLRRCDLKRDIVLELKMDIFKEHPALKNLKASQLRATLKVIRQLKKRYNHDKL